MVLIYLSGTQPVKAELVPTGFASSEANTVLVPNASVPSDFMMNFHTYTYTGGVFVRSVGVDIDDRILDAPVFLHERALVIGANTPLL